MSKQFLKVFNAIADHSRKTEDTASGIISAIRKHRVGTLERFDRMVTAAYDAAGWNHKPGRPLPGVEIVPVPDSVRAYVSEVRAAYREGLDVLKFRNMYELRKAVREARRPTPAEAPRLEALKGLRITAEDRFNDALFHDLIVTYELADEETRESIERSARRLLGKYKARVEPRMAA